MKTLSVAFLLLLLGLNAFAGAGGHGGDPYLEYAEDFPDKQKLEAGIDLALAKISAAPIPVSLKESLTTEIQDLQAKNKFLYIESIIILSKDGPDTYNLPQDARAFASLGAMTGEDKGSHVYFSKRALKHELSRFSEVIIHEVLHHLTTESLNEDEEYIEELARGIIASKISKSLMFALADGIYIRPHVIRTNQLFDFIIKRLGTPDCKKRESKDKDENCAYLILENKYKLLRKLPTNVMEWTFKTVVEELLNHWVKVEMPGFGNIPRRDQISLAPTSFLKVQELVKTAFVEAGLTESKKEFPVWFCKKDFSYFSSCKDDDYVRLIDLY